MVSMPRFPPIAGRWPNFILFLAYLNKVLLAVFLQVGSC